jgi:hypothetical protein
MEDSDESDEIQLLTEMGGWTRDQCRAAMVLGGTLDAAAELLLGGFQLPVFGGAEMADDDVLPADDVDVEIHLDGEEEEDDDDDDDDEGEEEEEEEEEEDDDEDGSGDEEEEGEEEEGSDEEEDDDDEEGEDDDEEGTEEDELEEEPADPLQEMMRLLGHDDDPAYLEAALVALQAVSRASNESLRKLGIPVRHISQ